MMHRYPSTQRYKLPLLLIGSIALVAIGIDAFGLGPSSIIGQPRTLWEVRRTQRLQLQSHAPSDELLSLTDSDENEKDEDKIKSAITSLESSFISSNKSTDNENDPSRFDPLIGLYQVKSVLTSKKGDNPVGGKWTRSNGLAQKLFKTRASFQHLLPFNATGLSLSRSEAAVAEAINVVSLDALDGLLRITVILRGDAVPLSSEERCKMNTNRTITDLTNLVVRAYFDPPRIFFGKRKKGNKYSYLPLQLGPTSSVILDTTYYDKMVRVGMGGTSGTRFVFTTTTEEEANEYEALLKIPYAKKRKVIGRLGVIMAASLYVAFGSVGANRLGLYASKVASMIANAKFTATAVGVMKRAKPWIMTGMRIFAGVTSVFSALATLLILFSSGGIERDGVSRSESPSP